ncbi:THAP domain-containing protein 4-like isoform X2 [Anneissia japonica]|uniref:THAP domain-containing protein 4-like isoform X2 n=1 Tax=Anneissia japonica TaxID=1529436 RepID=UPI001425AFE6|nr:THAP domain-containing protein 4-like isoform X2 [Anneissia japonica]
MPILQGERMSDSFTSVPIHEAVKCIEWLLGKWKSESSKGQFPTIESFTYEEEATFSHVGQPMLNFSFNSWHHESGKPLHRETGFLRVNPGTNEVAYISAQNFGVVELEEGIVEGTGINLESTTIGRMSFAKDPIVTKVKRTFKLTAPNTLEQTVFMATSKIPEVKEHLWVRYKKIDS